MTRYCDFRELEKLNKRLKKAVRQDSPVFNREKLMRTLLQEELKAIILTAELGKNGSNWYNYEYVKGDDVAHYLLKGRAHVRGTWSNGWVTIGNACPEFGTGCKPSQDAIKLKAASVPIKITGGVYTTELHNNAPYSRAVEFGHYVRMPYFMGPDGFATPKGHGPITGYVGGKRWTRDAIRNCKPVIEEEVSIKAHKMIKRVVWGR